jgi:hypothetical protein
VNDSEVVMTYRMPMVACGLALSTGAPAQGQFQTFQGNAATEQAWRSATGSPVPLENFESFNGVSGPFAGPSDPVTHLESLRIRRYGAAAGTYPGVYSDGTFAHSGVNQIANFGAGGAGFSDYYFEPDPGLSIRAVGFWQCDPQGDVVFEAYGAGNVLVGTIRGLINNGTGNSFAAFISEVPIVRVRVLGNEGDGWNHTDDWQVVVTPAACYANCDASTQAPVLNVGDFTCFLQKYASADPYANCDGSTQAPVLNVGDFTCFLQKYSAGCF